jgi:hypothetical protein
MYGMMKTGCYRIVRVRQNVHPLVPSLCSQFDFLVIPFYMRFDRCLGIRLPRVATALEAGILKRERTIGSIASHPTIK